MTAAAFLKNGSFAERVLWEISGTCVDTKALKQLALSVVTGETPCKLAFQAWATKILD